MGEPEVLGVKNKGLQKKAFVSHTTRTVLKFSSDFAATDWLVYVSA